jgi:hypothetical protein
VHLDSQQQVVTQNVRAVLGDRSAQNMTHHRPLDIDSTFYSRSEPTPAVSPDDAFHGSLEPFSVPNSMAYPYSSSITNATFGHSESNLTFSPDNMESTYSFSGSQPRPEHYVVDVGCHASPSRCTHLPAETL